MPAEKNNSKASEARRSNKPLMEKRRRARINQSLTELKALILDAVKKDTSRHNKLEKADILEMTVKYLQNLQRQQLAARLTTDPTITNKFRAGFGECASEVTRFLDRAEGLEPSVRDRLSSHLTTCLSGIERKRDPLAADAPSSTASATVTTATLSEGASASASPSSTEASPRSTPSPTHSQMASTATSSPAASPAASRDLNNNGGFTSADLVAAFKAPVFSGLQLIPTRLANGEIAFILPTQHALAAAHVLASQVTMATATATTANLPMAAAKLVPDEAVKQEEQTMHRVSSNDDSESSSSSRDSSRDAESPPQAEDINKLNRPGNHSNGMLFIKEEGVWRPW